MTAIAISKHKTMVLFDMTAGVPSCDTTIIVQIAKGTKAQNPHGKLTICIKQSTGRGGV